MYFGGPTVPRVPYQWNHVCTSVQYTQEGAKRSIYSDGGISFNHTSDFLKSSRWQKGRNFTFGGEETYYYGSPLEGYLTDIQIFSRALTKDEMTHYTTCEQVNILSLIASVSQYA